jgi:hypothetical protein
MLTTIILTDYDDLDTEYEGVFAKVTNDHDYCFLKSLNIWEISDSFNSFNP